MSWLSGKEKTIVKEGVWDQNPITFQILGICSALAVTVKLETAFLMCVSLVFVLSFSNLIVSLLREMIPAKIRIIIELTVISALVIIADQCLKAFAFEVSKQLSVFVGLIITNCIVLGRAEAFALKNPPGKSFLDGFANGLGYSAVLMAVAFFREILGSGTLFGFKIIPQAVYQAGYVNNGIMVLAPGAFFLLGAIIWVQRALSGYREE